MISYEFGMLTQIDCGCFFFSIFPLTFYLLRMENQIFFLILLYMILFHAHLILDLLTNWTMETF